MKRIYLLSILIIGFITLKAQPVNVQSAYNYLNKGKYDKAKDPIDQAIQDPKTSTWAKTWYYRGNIYLNICISKDPKIKSLDTNALQIAYDAYQKAIELDKDKEFLNEIIQQLIVCGEQFYNKGVEHYNKKLYTKSLTSFEKAVNINAVYSKIDTLAMYYAALSADFANQQDLAKKYFSKLYKLNYKKAPIYMYIQKMYKKNKDTAKALEAIKKGLEFFPDNLNLIIEETNIYLAKGQTEEAQNNLMKAIDKDPNNPNLYFAIGSNYDKIYYDTSKTRQERMSAYGQSEIHYKKAIELKPDYFDANYNLGALYVNESIRILEAADKIEDPNKYDAEKSKVDALWNKALPYLEKAHQLQPDDFNTLISLRQLYARTKQYEKENLIKKQIEDLKQKK